MSDRDGFSVTPASGLGVDLTEFLGLPELALRRLEVDIRSGLEYMQRFP